MLLDTTISVKLKELFDRVYLSKSVFDKMTNLVTQIQNFYDVTDLNQRASDIYALVLEITNNVAIIDAYEICINNITTAKNEFDADYTDNLNKIIQYYAGSVYETTMAAIELMRISTLLLDQQYASVRPDVVILTAPYREFIDKISLVKINPITITPDPNTFGAYVPLTKKNCLQNIPTKPLMYAVVENDHIILTVLENGGYGSTFITQIALVQIEDYFNSAAGYPAISVGNFDTSGGRSFFSSDSTFVVYVNCSVAGINYNLPVVFNIDYSLVLNIIFMNYAFITDCRFLDFQSLNGQYMKSFLYFKLGSLYWSTSGGTIFSTTLNIPIPSQMGYILFDTGNYAYLIKDNKIEFVKIKSYTSGDNLHEMIEFTTNVIGVTPTPYGLFVLTSNGDLYNLNIPSSLDSGVNFDVTSVKVANTGIVYNTSTPFDGVIGMGIVSDRLFIVYPSNRFFYQITETLYTDENIGYLKSNFIPTDDFFPWYTVRKPKEVVAKKCIIFGYEGHISSELSSIDEPNPVYDGNLFGPESMRIAHSPVINDVVVSVDKGGFAVTSINSKTGETYVRIIDEYEPDISVGNANIDMQQIQMQCPEPHVIISVNEISECDIMVRRHAEMSKPSPTQYYALLWNPGLKVVNMNGVIDSVEGPSTFAKTSGLSYPIGTKIKMPKGIIGMVRYICSVGEVILFTTIENRVYAMNSNFTKLICVSDKLSNFRTNISRYYRNSSGQLSGGTFTLSKGSYTGGYSNTCLVGIFNASASVTFEINPVNLSIRNVNSLKPIDNGGIYPLLNFNNKMYVRGGFDATSYTALDGSGQITIPCTDQAWTDIDIVDIPFNTSRFIVFKNDMNTGNSMIMLYRADGTYDTIYIDYFSDTNGVAKYATYSYNVFSRIFEISLGALVKRYQYNGGVSGSPDNLTYIDDLNVSGTSQKTITALGGGFYYDGRLLYSSADTHELYNGEPLDYSINKIIQCYHCTFFITPNGLKICPLITGFLS